MKKEDIHFGDFKRILFGESPPIFLVEVFIRTLIIYIILLFILRWLGKRMSGQLTIMELAVMLTLGAIVCVPMQLPDKGILQGVVLLLCALLFQRGISLIGFNNGKFEDILQGKATVLIKNGVLQLDEMKSNRISRQQIYAELRKIQIFNLGMIDRVYLEACGIYSIFKSDHPKPGLSILPNGDDPAIADEQTERTTNLQRHHEHFAACKNCGAIKPEDDTSACRDCGKNDWTKAVI